MTRFWLTGHGQGAKTHHKQFESVLVPKTFTLAFARRDKRQSRESRPSGETKFHVYFV